MSESEGEEATAAKTTTRTSGSRRAGLTFPVGRIHRQLRQGNFAKRVGRGAAVYLGGVLEYLTAEVLDGAFTADKHLETTKKSRITPRMIQMAVRHDSELGTLLNNVTIAEGGVLPQVHGQVVSKQSGASTSGKKKTSAGSKAPKTSAAKKSSIGSTSGKKKSSVGSTSKRSSVGSRTTKTPTTTTETSDSDFEISEATDEEADDGPNNDHEDSAQSSESDDE